MDDRLEEKKQKLLAEAQAGMAAFAQQASQAQRGFLSARAAALQQLADSILQQEGLTLLLPTGQEKSSQLPALFDRDRLEEFAAGSVERCLGAEYAVFGGRRIPRIPNGDLLLMDRVLAIKGVRSKISVPAEIVTELEVPVDAWYIQESGFEGTPYSVLMEMALQPCGFLSAYLGTMLISPHSNLFFRNLDGVAHLSQRVDLRGKTVRAWARLTAHTVNEETVIQKFDFELKADGQPFYDGNSVFGFFPEETMRRQIGLDGGKTSQPVLTRAVQGQPALKAIHMRADEPLKAATPTLQSASARFALLDQVVFDRTGGSKGLGRIYASRKIDAGAWYFKNHFFQDPVMPGSLGVEAMIDALRIFAIEQGYGATWQQARFALDESTFHWKYRGQILQAVDTMHLEIDMQQIERQASEMILTGNASLWADQIRIYEVKNISIRIIEGNH